MCVVHLACAQPTAAQANYASMLDAETALVENIWGNSEEFLTHSRARVPPYVVVNDVTGESGPCRVDVSVLVEKIKIDTVNQVATIKWWLRQNWRDPRLAWDPADYTYGKSEQTGVVNVINRRAGPEAGGTWVPDMVLWYDRSLDKSSRAKKLRFLQQTSICVCAV